MTLSIVLPCYNEEANITDTVRDVLSWLKKAKIAGEVIVVDDGSKDGSLKVLSALQKRIKNLRVVRHEKNKGYGAAVRSGCDAAKGEIIGYMDSDGQFKASDFSKLLPHMKNYDFVTGRRRHRADSPMRKMNAKLFGFLNLAVLGIWVRDINCAMKMFRRTTWQKIRPTHATGALVNAEMFYNLKRKKIPWYQVDVRHFKRMKGVQTGAKLSVILRMFKEMQELKRDARASRK